MTGATKKTQKPLKNEREVDAERHGRHGRREFRQKFPKPSNDETSKIMVAPIYGPSRSSF